MGKRELVWTQQAIDCYNIGCWCEKCTLNDVMNTSARKCNMKAIVIELVRLYGKPKPIVTKESRFNLEQIKSWLTEGFHLKEIAKMYGVNEVTLRKYTHANGLVGYKLCELKKKKGNWRV